MVRRTLEINLGYFILQVPQQISPSVWNLGQGKAPHKTPELGLWQPQIDCLFGHLPAELVPNKIRHRCSCVDGSNELDLLIHQPARWAAMLYLPCFFFFFLLSFSSPSTAQPPFIVGACLVY
jgi:hypothetical protein